MGKRNTSWPLLAAMLMPLGCIAEPTLVASNCDKPEGCAKTEALKIDAVDILLVVDDSKSISGSSQLLKAELPRLLNAITTGDGAQTSFPPAKSVHIAVATTDMGVGAPNEYDCTVQGRDAVFVKPGEVGVTCDVSYPGYLAFEGGAAPIATVATVGCVPLVTNDYYDGPVISDPNAISGPSGCGFEQPLEAALKALWPAADTSIAFNHGQGHGSDENAGFLRDDSLLVVLVVTDEDDCSAEDLSLFETNYPNPALNLRCLDNPDKLFDVQRYVDGLKTLRPDNDNVIFGVIGGVPADLVSDEFRADYDFSSSESVAAYYDALLAAPSMEAVAVETSPPKFAYIRPSCEWIRNDGMILKATPPRRLIEAAKRFGTRSVVGSLCGPDFGATTGTIVRAIGERLTEAANN